MRVLLVAKPWKGGLAGYLFDALRERVGTQVEWIATTPTSASQRRSYLQNRQAWRMRRIEQVNETKRDIALFVNLPAGAEGIANHRGNVLWMTDAAQANAQQLSPYAKVFASDPGHASSLAVHAGQERFAGVLPFAMSPNVHHSSTARAPRRDACFIGNRDRKRDAHIAALLDAPCSATVVGNYFLGSTLYWRAPHCFRPRVSIDAMAAVYARHRVSLNVHAAVVAGGTNMRTFECAGYGIPQLVEDRPGLEELFEAGREIATYREPDEIADAIDKLLVDDARAAAMAMRARRRALHEHTYTHRVERMLAALGACTA